MVQQRCDWRRVTAHDRCPVCESDTWCTVAPDGSAVRCKRVESPRPCPGDDGEAWLHILREHRPRPRTRPMPMLALPSPGLTKLAIHFRQNATAPWIEQAANRLGVAPAALLGLGAGRDCRGNLAIPMFNASGTVVGIRIRTPGGRKFAVTGSHDGVFLHLRAGLGDCPLLFPEGPTSAAAALTLGYPVVGRPSCSGGVKHCVELARGRDCVVVADPDPPGQRGAEHLSNALLVVAKSVRVVTPPVKDLRDWLRAGADHADVEALIAAAPVRRLTVRYRA